MALRLHGNQRDANEQEIIDCLEAAHCTVEKIDVPCDLIVGRNHGFERRTYLLEVKTEKGKLTPDQFDFQTEWRGQYAIVRNCDEALKAVGIVP